MREAKTHLVMLAELDWQAEEILIARDGEPFPCFSPYRGAAGRDQRLKARERTLSDRCGARWLSPNIADAPVRAA